MCFKWLFRGNRNSVKLPGNCRHKMRATDVNKQETNSRRPLKGILKSRNSGNFISSENQTYEMLSLKAWSAASLSYNQTTKLDASQISIFALAMIELIENMGQMETIPEDNGLYKVFMEKGKHACRIRKYKVRGMMKQAQDRAICWCYCPKGPLCNCSCSALLDLLMEYRENQCWRTKGPNLPKIDLKAPIKSFLFKRLHDPDLFYFVNRFKKS